MPPRVEALLMRLPGCARLGADELALLAAGARTQEYAPATRLVSEGEPAPDWYAVLESGAVQLTRVDLEADEILDYLTAGDVLDPGAPGAPAAWSAEAVEPVRCLLVPQALVATHRASLGAEVLGGYRGDMALYIRQARDLVKGPPVTCAPTTPVSEAARLMTARGIGSVVIADADARALGIITDRDLRSRVVAKGLSAATPVTAIMSSPLIAVEPERLAFDALLEMTRRNIHHLGVIEGGRLVGVVSSHDMLGLQSAHPVGLAREIEGAGSLDQLVTASPRLQEVVRWLAGGGAGAFDIGRIVAELNDRLVRRALTLVEAALAAEGAGRPPVTFSWLAAGSEGRREQTLKTDQDNGLVYDDPPPPLVAAAEAYFRRLATAAGAALVRLGFPLCPGGYMASNPRWCRSASEWRDEFATWMGAPEPERLLFASLYCDIRPVAGDEAPGRALWEWVCERAPSQTLFLRFMAHSAVERTPPLGLFGGFVVDRTGAHKGTLDLKGRAVFPMTQAMRVYALSLGVRETNTVDRLRVVEAREAMSAAEAGDLREAYEVISRLRLHHQLARLDAGLPPDNHLDPEEIGKADRLLLKEAFKAVGWLQRMLEDRFQTHLVS
jgi:CBS domain-containing protein